MRNRSQTALVYQNVGSVTMPLAGSPGFELSSWARCCDSVRRMWTNFLTLSSQKIPLNRRVVVYEHSCSPRPTMDQIGEHCCGNGLSERHRVPARGTAEEVVWKVSGL